MLVGGCKQFGFQITAEMYLNHYLNVTSKGGLTERKIYDLLEVSALMKVGNVSTTVNTDCDFAKTILSYFI